jgi:hypothetical protein
MDALDDQEADYRLGPEFDQTVAIMGTFLAKSSLELAQGVSATTCLTARARKAPSSRG